MTHPPEVPNLIHGRLSLTTTLEGLILENSVIRTLEDEYNSAVTDEILAGARRIAAEAGLEVVRVEVFYPDETEDTNSWDALEIDFTQPIPVVVTLPPYSEREP